MNTGISLNERFTQIQSKQPPQGRGRSRSRSRSRRIVDSGAGNPGVSAANSRLLQEFKRRHTVQTALKLKRVRVPQNRKLHSDSGNRPDPLYMSMSGSSGLDHPEDIESDPAVEQCAPSARSPNTLQPLRLSISISLELQHCAAAY